LILRYASKISRIWPYKLICVSIELFVFCISSGPLREGSGPGKQISGPQTNVDRQGERKGCNVQSVVITMTIRHISN